MQTLTSFNQTNCIHHIDHCSLPSRQNTILTSSLKLS